MAVPVESLRLASDGADLEAELALPDAPSAAFVLCHPHPLHGGTMRSVVIGALFEGLPASGIACIRFNFRGVEGSTGEHTGGDFERSDARAALDHLAGCVAGVPLVMAGWSFGGDVALSVRDERLAGWMAVAPPLRFGDRVAETGTDPRPKRLVLAQHDQFRPPSEIEAECAAWAQTQIDVVGGADHFFIGRTDHVTEAARTFAASLT